MLKALKHELIEIADPDKANVLSRFFKTGRGEYGEGDCFSASRSLNNAEQRDSSISLSLY